MHSNHNPQTVLNYASDRVVKPGTIWGSVVIAVVSGLASLLMFLGVLYLVLLALENPSGDMWLALMIAVIFALVWLIAAGLWFVSSIKQLRSRLAKPGNYRGNP
jgi:H+/Cl- antiporter ClcA